MLALFLNFSSGNLLARDLSDSGSEKFVVLEDSMVIFLTYLIWISLFLLIYSNVLYPLAMALLGSFTYKRKDVGFSQDDIPKVTLLVPAFNESKVIESKMRNIDAMEYEVRRMEVIVASDGSSDGTQELVRKHLCRFPLRLLDFQQRRGKTSVVNDALASCSTPLVCLCDANVMFRPDALKVMVERFHDPKVGAVTGDVQLASHESDFGNGESMYYFYERALQKGESLVGSVMGVDGGMYVIRRELFENLESDTILDDFSVSMRVIRKGFRIIYEPLAIADENGTPTSTAEYTRRVRVTKGAVQSIRRGYYPSFFKQPVAYAQWFSHKFLRWANPLLLLALLLGSGMLSGYYSLALYFFIAQILFYGIGVLAFIFPSLRDKPIIGIIYFFVLSHAAMLEGIYKGLGGNYSAIWNRTERVAR